MIPPTFTLTVGQKKEIFRLGPLCKTKTLKGALQKSNVILQKRGDAISPSPPLVSPLRPDRRTWLNISDPTRQSKRWFGVWVGPFHFWS